MNITAEQIALIEAARDRFEAGLIDHPTYRLTLLRILGLPDENH